MLVYSGDLHTLESGENMLNQAEITEAMRLLSLDGRNYFVQRFAGRPDLSSATVITAWYHKTTLSVHTNKGMIKLTGIGGFKLLDDGNIEVYQNNGDRHPTLELWVIHMSDDYLAALTAVNARLGRPDPDSIFPGQLEKR